MAKTADTIAIYSRKSRYTGKGESIGNQIDLCREYIRTHYGDAAAEHAVVFEDEGFSGGNLNRPDFKKMMTAAKDRKFKAIVVYRLDRISRNISDFSSLIEELGRLGIDFVSIRESFDTSSPMGRAMMYIASVFSQLERETIAERIRDNMHELAKTGRWLGGTTPTGFESEAIKSITVDGKTKKACKLKLVPEEADIVKTIFDLYVETDSLTLTEAALIKQGFKTKNGKYFTRFSVKAILQNPVYMVADQEAYDFFIKNDTDLFSEHDAFDGVHGMMAYNRTDQEKGRASISLPPSEWIVSVGKHPGLIPGKVWVQVQESLERNKSKSFRKPRSNEALLTGLLFFQNAAEQSVNGWMVTYFKGSGIIAGTLAAYTVTVMWGATLVGRLLIAFVFPFKKPRKAMVGMSVLCTVFYVLLVMAHTQGAAIALLFAFAISMSGLNPTAVASAGRMTSVTSMGIMLPVASSGAILMPWIIGMVAERVGLAAGMASNIVPCVGLVVFAILVAKLPEE